MADVTLSSILSSGFPYRKQAIITSSQTWTLPSTAAPSVEYDIIGGGGAGAGETSSYLRSLPGGGGGERIKGLATLTPGSGYSVIVGSGGAGRSALGADGGSSSFNSISARGGHAATESEGGRAGNGAPQVVSIANYYSSYSGGGGAAGVHGAAGLGGVCSGGSGGYAASVPGVAGGGGGGYSGARAGGAATTPGGGGGGGYKLSTDASMSGGSGYRGEVRITYWDSVP